MSTKIQSSDRRGAASYDAHGAYGHSPRGGACQGSARDHAELLAHIVRRLGGDAGGNLVAIGTPEEIAANP